MVAQLFAAPLLALATAAMLGVPGPDDRANPTASTHAAGLRAPITASTPTPRTPGTALAGFGAAVAFDGERIFVGNPDEFAFFPMPPANPGQVHVFAPEADGTWTERAALTLPEVDLGEGFGMALAAHDGWLAVGAPAMDDGRGAAFLFREVGPAWLYLGKAQFDEAARVEGDAFGSSVTLGDGWLAIGAPGAVEGVGRVALFELPEVAEVEARADEGWMELLGTPVLLSPDVRPASGDLVGTGGPVAFGSSVALRDGRLAIGAPGPGLAALQTGATPQPGAVHVFEAEVADDGGTGWFRTAHLESPTEGPAMLGAAVHFGAGGDLFAGAPLAGSGKGAVERFVAADGGRWRHAGTLTAEGDLPGQAFVGLQLAEAGGQLLAGAPFASTVIVFGAAEGAGAEGAGTDDADMDDAWVERARVANTGAGNGFFGMALAGSGEHFVVGAPGASIYAGLGFLYRWTAGGDDAAGAADGAAGAAGEWQLAQELADTPMPLTAYADDEPALCEEGTAGRFGCSDVDLVTFMPLDQLGAKRGVMVNDIWGWTDPETGHEWALVGRTDGMSFVDITDPAAPFYAGEILLTEGATSNIWRDMKVYADHAFIVADAAGQHGMQVFDLRQLREVTPSEAPVTFSESAIYTEIASAHNVIINEDSGFAYLVGGSSGGTTCGGGLHMVDIRDPLNPQFAGCFAEVGTGRSGTGTSHDAQCVNYHGPDADFAGREICFGSNETALSIADVTDKSNPVSIATATYPNSAYLHQGWISDDHRWFYMNDELDELGGQVSRTRTLVWNIEELDDPILVNEHLGTNPASDHNLYVRGDYMYQSNYVSGLRILDISDPENPEEVGYFDTVVAGPDAPGFAGSWSNFPFFESGKIIVSSMREGLFVVRHRARPTVF